MKVTFIYTEPHHIQETVNGIVLSDAALMGYYITELVNKYKEFKEQESDSDQTITDTSCIQQKQNKNIKNKK